MWLSTADFKWVENETVVFSFTSDCQMCQQISVTVTFSYTSQSSESIFHSITIKYKITRKWSLGPSEMKFSEVSFSHLPTVQKLSLGRTTEPNSAKWYSFHFQALQNNMQVKGREIVPFHYYHFHQKPAIVSLTGRELHMGQCEIFLHSPFHPSVIPIFLNQLKLDKIYQQPRVK